MAGAITICARNATQDRILSLWHRAAVFEREPSMLKLNYPPHLTFVVFDEIDQQELHRAAQAVFAGINALRVAFDRIDCFEGPPPVLWAAPQNRKALDELHRNILDHLPTGACREHYRPDSWIPHCTLATTIRDDKHAAAREFAAQDIEPFEVAFDSAECVSFPPVSVTQCLPLGEAS